MRTVIIDDDFSTLESIVFTLERLLGYSVYHFNDPEKGLDYISQNSEDIDVVFVDEKMPGINGREFGRRVSKLEYSNFVPLVMLTAYKEFDYALEALSECGYDYFIWKNDFDTKDKILNAITFVFSLPKVQMKIKFKSAERRIAYLTEEINGSLVKSYVEDINSCINNSRDKKTHETLLRHLEVQEELLSLMKDLGIRSTMYNLSGGMTLMERDAHFFRDNTNAKVILEELRFPDNFSKYDLNKNAYNRLKKIFQCFDENKIYTKGALIVKSIFTNSTDSFPVTSLEARRGRNSYTFVTEILSVM